MNYVILCIGRSDIINQVILSGCLVNDNVVRYSENGTAILRNTIAVRRKFKNADGVYEADFISIKAFGKTAEYMENNSSKGTRILIGGRIQTGGYENKEGNKVYTTEVVVNETTIMNKALDKALSKEEKKDSNVIYPDDLVDIDENFLD